MRISRRHGGQLPVDSTTLKIKLTTVSELDLFEKNLSIFIIKYENGGFKM